MKICIVGSAKLHQRVVCASKDNKLLIDYFDNPIKALKAINGGYFWSLAFVDSKLVNFSTKAFVCLLKHKIPLIKVVQIGTQDIFSESQEILQTLRCYSIQKEASKIKYLVYNKEKKLLFKNGSAIPISLREWSLLSFLIRNQGRVVQKESIIEAVWGQRLNHHSRSLDTYIRRLRNKLGNDVIKINTIPKIGLILLALQ